MTFRRIIPFLMILAAACFMPPGLVLGARISGDQGVVESSEPAVASPGSNLSPGSVKQNEPLNISGKGEAAPAQPGTPQTKPAVAPAQPMSGMTSSETSPGNVPAQPAAPKSQQPAQVQESPGSREPRKTGGHEAKIPPRENRYVTIDFDNVDIGVFVKFVSELTGKNFIIDEKVKGKVTVISPKKIRVDEVYKVFESVLEVNGFATVPSGDIIKIVPALQAREKSVEMLLGSEGVQPEDKIVTQIITLEYANTEEVRKILEPLISRNSVIQSYPPTGMIIVTDILSNIRRLQQIVDALDVQGVGEQLTYVPLQFATARDVSESLTVVFTQIKGIAPIRVVPDDRNNSLIVIATEDDTGRVKQLISLMDKEVPRAGANLHVYRLQNAVAEDLAKVLMSLPKDVKEAGAKGKMPVLSKDVQIVADKPTNTLIITADRGDYQLIEDVIKKLDIARPMVYIEALIMEVSVTKNFSLGVEWRGIKDAGHISGFDTGEAAVIAGSGGLGTGGGYNIIPGTPTVGQPVDFPGGFSVGVLGAGISIGGVLLPNIGAVLQAYRNDDDVSILSTPQMLTMDNEEAEINVGENIPYVTRKETSTTSLDYSTYEYKDVGVILNITPHISEDNYVRLKMNQQVTKVVTAQSTLGLPTTLKRAAKTTVVVKDNETVVIGGMIGDNTEDTKYTVPWLGSIPLLGWLFKSKASTQEKTNLFIFVTPHIIRTHNDVEALYKEKRGIIGEVEGGVVKMHDKESGAAVNTKSSSGDKDGW